ncbi:MAG: hypothetical protein KBF17_15655, partial [Candidatus Promineofilum sp.]|nr:hypothetical protein [Promineifilum sp.]MBP9658049.1 hypothetical protein [Promineifilum sp.]
YRFVQCDMISHENPLLFGWFGHPMITGVVLFILSFPDFGKALLLSVKWLMAFGRIPWRRPNSVVSSVADGKIAAW